MNLTRDNNRNEKDKLQEDLSRDMDGNFNEEEYKKQVEFYEKMIKDNQILEYDSKIGEIKYNNNIQNINEKDKRDSCERNDYNERGII